VILAGSRENQVVNIATLKIIRKGPEEVNLAIVDIPGLVSGESSPESSEVLSYNVFFVSFADSPGAASHEANQAAVQLVDEYVKNPKSIILLGSHNMLFSLC